MKKTAIIIGSKGQDGTILFNDLKNKNYSILGIDKDSIQTHNLDWDKKIDINNSGEVVRAVNILEPDEIYHLAAYHHSSQDTPENELNILQKSYETHVFSLANFLEAIKSHSPNTHLFYAASSLIFGTEASGLVNEDTPYNPDTPYGLSKLCGLNLCKMYREKHNLFTSVGIFFNHESELRPKKFISRKIIQGAIDIKNGKKKSLEIGNLKAEVDWGYAPDYMDAAQKILSANKPDDFIVATGESHSVQELIEISFSHLNLDWKDYVTEDKNIITRKRNAITGDPSKLQKTTNWKPSVNFNQMIKKIISDLST